MVANKFKFGFSLAEATISLIILATVSLCLIPVLSKQKPGAGIDPTTVRGGFLCYYDETGALKQILLHERKQDLDYPDVENGAEDCVLQESKRPGRFYYLMVGAGSQNVPGQVVTGYTPIVSGDLIIHPGKVATSDDDASDSNDTKITIHNSDGGDGSKFTASSAYGVQNNDNTLLPKNIKACKLISGECPSVPSGSCPEGDNRKPAGCSYVDYSTFIDEIQDNDGVEVVAGQLMAKIPAIKIDGCDCTDDTGSQYLKDVEISNEIKTSTNGEQIVERKVEKMALNIIPIKDIKRVITYSDNQTPNLGRLDLRSYNSSISYEENSDRNRKLVFNIDLLDSSFDKDLGNRVHFSEILNNLSPLRQNKYINKVIESTPGAKANETRNTAPTPGAVVILW